MKKILILAALLVSQAALSQPKVAVQVYPGTELLNVVQLLSGKTQTVKSTYQKDLLEYFQAFKDHPAVKMARALPYINCDFPVRLSWAFYNFPDIKLAELTSLDGYEDEFTLKQINDYFRACVQFYYDSKFWEFYQKYQPHYDQWIASFKRNLYEEKMLATVDSFYHIRQARPITFTLGALNCGTYAIPDLGTINPFYKNRSLVMVAYGNLLQQKASMDASPDFFSPDWSTQLIWHEMGHTYLYGLFEANKEKVQELKYILDRDTLMQKKARGMGWPMYLNENVTQAVTSLLRIHHGKAERAEELARITEEKFYVLSPAMIEIMERDYYKRGRYKNFADFFPVLLNELEKKYPK